jgi:GTP-binding protein
MNSMRRDLKLGAIPLRMNMRAPKNPFDRDRALDRDR